MDNASRAVLQVCYICDLSMTIQWNSYPDTVGTPHNVLTIEVSLFQGSINAQKNLLGLQKLITLLQSVLIEGFHCIYIIMHCNGNYNKNIIGKLMLH